MTTDAHLWGIGFEDTDRAEQVRGEVARLVETHCLNLLDTAVAVHYPDGCVTLDGEPFVAASKFGGNTFADFLAALALGAPPLTGFLRAVFLPNCRTLSTRRSLLARRWTPDESSRV
jgi:hypothetical protein